MKNMGSLDRLIRFVAGLVLIVLPFVTNALAGWGAWQYVVSAVGVVLIVTAAVSFCPAYRILGIRTCKLS